MQKYPGAHSPVGAESPDALQYSPPGQAAQFAKLTPFVAPLK